MLRTPPRRPLPLVVAMAAALALVACGGTDDSEAPVSLPAQPAGLGYEDSAAPPAGVAAYVDTGASNQRNDPCLVTLETNAGVRVVKGMLDIWEPLTRQVDAGVTLAAANGCAAVTASTWSGLPGTAPDGTVRHSAIHQANIDYVVTATQNRSSAQALAAYLDDRRGKGFSVSDGMGPLTSLWRAGTGQTTTITAVDPLVAVSKVDDKGNNLGSTSAPLGQAVSFIDSGNIVDGSTEPAKRFYKYARPYRWSTAVMVVPALESAKSSTAPTDGGFISGHTAEAWRDTLPMAYLFPQRYQELITRAMEMGENRILAGMHSPLDVMGGRIQATAVVAYALNKTAMNKAATYQLVQDYLRTQTGASDFNALLQKARTPVTTDTGSVDHDRFANYASNKAFFNQKLTYGLPKISANDGKAAVVPKGAEVLLETRLPYLSAAQRRVVLKTTQIDSGHPLANDEEGWGRLNLFAAADGYGAFNGDVALTMDASLGGFHAADAWKNDIGGAGLLTKAGSGALTLSGHNSWSGGTVLTAGTLIAASANALGRGDVYQRGGVLAVPSALALAGKYTQLAGATLQLQLGAAGEGRITAAGEATVQGQLVVKFANGYKPGIGDTLQVISARSRQGTFSSVTVEGFKATAVYTATGVQLRIDAAA